MVNARKAGRRRPTPHQEALARPKSRVLAIRAKCWDCEGQDGDPGWQRRVRTCMVTDCPLWHVRPYQDSSDVSGEIVPETRVYRGSADRRIEMAGRSQTPAGAGR
jgi:hypothetical protein